MPKRRWTYALSLLALTAVLLTACAPAQSPAPAATEPPPSADPTTPAAQASTPQAIASEGDPVRSGNSCEEPFDGQQVQFSTLFWDRTDFCLHSVDYSEFLSGGPPPDGIPAIDEPLFESVAQADEWLGDTWPVMYFELSGDARAYPLAILIWHEIVNDVVAGQPVTLTFCPLCNATIAFNRQLPDGRVLDFGTTGNLRNSDLVMYDRQTQSWWQQFTGTAVVGTMTGTQLEFLPSQIISWSDFKERSGGGKVLSRETGYVRQYGVNPYTGYDSPDNSRPFLFTAIPDERLQAMERVAAIKIDDSAVAYPFKALSDNPVINDEVAGQPIVVFWKFGTGSALDARSFENGRDIGSTGVYSRQVGDQVLTFELNPAGGFSDRETASTWNIFGEAVEGPLAGTRLQPIVSGEHFWFAWAAFEPDTAVWAPAD